MEKIGICICTYNRIESLQRSLTSLNSLKLLDNHLEEILIFVVDNNYKGNANKVIDCFLENHRFPINYSIEPKKGISFARNHAIKKAKDCEYIIFVDDDEITDPDWLIELLNIQKEKKADIVCGPVLPLFEKEPPSWIIKGGFFSRKRFTNGEKLDYAATGNILFRSKWLTRCEEPFDSRFNLTGGEDTAFTKKIIQEGATCVWADNAIVYEYNPPNRFKVSWILLRSLRIGWTLTRIDKYLNKSFSNLLVRLIKSIFHILKGFFLILPYLIIMGFAGLIKSLSFIFRGVGELLGFTPIKYQPYK